MSSDRRPLTLKEPQEERHNEDRRDGVHHEVCLIGFFISGDQVYGISSLGKLRVLLMTYNMRRAASCSTLKQSIFTIGITSGSKYLHSTILDVVISDV